MMWGRSLRADADALVQLLDIDEKDTLLALAGVSGHLVSARGLRCGRELGYVHPQRLSLTETGWEAALLLIVDGAA